MDCALAGAKGSSAKQPSNDSSFKWPRVKSTPVPEMLTVNRGRAGRLERHQLVEAGILHIPDEALSRHATIECDIARRVHREPGLQECRREGAGPRPGETGGANAHGYQATTDAARCRGDAVRALSLWASAKLAKAQSRHNAIELSFFITSYLSIYKQLRRWISPVLSEL